MATHKLVRQLGNRKAGTTITVDGPHARTLVRSGHLADPDTAATEPSDVFDPNDHNVDKVQKYLDNADDDERQRVIDAEADGQNRKGIVNHHNGA